MHRPAAPLIRTLIILGAVVALIVAIGAAGSASVRAAPKPKPTPTPVGTPTPTPTPPPIPAGLRAGLRASNYGITPFPSPSWWVDSIGSLASRFTGSTREQLAVVVEVSGGGGRGKCWAHFPQPATGTWPNVNWDDTDLFESTFDAFDAAGIKVWLQVEPASCDVPMLIDLVYQQYGHHSSVIGFGVDDEWYRKDLARYGKPITDAEAAAWVAQVRTKDAADLVLVKHWLIEKMPPTYRDGLVFVDDSQGHGSLANMVDEFEAWGDAFAPAPVGFQFGYQSDKKWWSALSDPPREIGNALLSRIPNTRDLLWVDFTAYDIWPPE
jgi:hypothetical protein